MIWSLSDIRAVRSGGPCGPGGLIKRPVVNGCYQKLLSPCLLARTNQSESNSIEGDWNGAPPALCVGRTALPHPCGPPIRGESDQVAGTRDCSPRPANVTRKAIAPRGLLDSLDSHDYTDSRVKGWLQTNPIPPHIGHSVVLSRVRPNLDKLSSHYVTTYKLRCTNSAAARVGTTRLPQDRLLPWPCLILESEPRS